MTIAFQAVVLDMDGLVLDTEPTYRSAWRQAAADLGFSLSDEFCLGLAGRHYEDVERALLGAFGSGFSLPRFREVGAALWRKHVEERGIAVKPGFHRFFQQLKAKDIPFCLATNSHRVNAFECLHLAGIAGYFPEIVSRDDVALGKPAPDLYLEAARRVRVSPMHCLALEDSETGLKAARRAGIRAILIPDGLAPSEEAKALALRILPSLEEAAALLFSAA